MATYPSQWPSITFLANSLLLEFLGGLWLGYVVVRGVRLNVKISALLGAVSLIVLILVPRIGPPNARGITWGIPALLIVQAVVALESRFGRLWPRWSLLLGDASYSLYLSHLVVPPVMVKLLLHTHVLAHAGAPIQNAIPVVSFFVFALLVAFPLYFWVEKPLTNLLRLKLIHERLPRAEQHEEFPATVLKTTAVSAAP